MSRILIIEDNRKLNRLLQQGLEEAGYEVASAHTLNKGEELWTAFQPHLVILDAGLPDGDGIETLAHVRERDAATLVLMLTARDTETDRLNGFASGADDYMVKPFSFPELLARIARHLARAFHSGESPKESTGPWRVEMSKQLLFHSDQHVELTPREMRILILLLDADGDLVTRETIYEEVWPEAQQHQGLQNTLEVHLSHLREKLKNLCSRNPIQTVRGKGYRFQDHP